MNLRFVKNTGWLLFGSIFKLVFSFVVNILWARYLGPSNLGTLNYVAIYTTFFTSLCGLGLEGIIVHELVNHNEDGKIIGTAIGLRLIFGIVSMFTMVIVIYLIDSADEQLVKMAILQAIQLPFCAFDSIRYWYQRNLCSKWEVKVAVSTSILSAVYKWYILIANKNVIWFALGTTIDVVVLGSLYMASYRYNAGKKLLFSIDTAKRMLNESPPFLVASMVTFIYSKIDILMIRHILGEDSWVGLYSVAIVICSYISFVPNAILDSARPIVMEAKQNCDADFVNNMKRLIVGIAGIAIAYSFCITLFGEQVVLLLYGKQYYAAVTCLRIAVWFTAFSYLGGVKSVWIVCEKKNRFVPLLVIMGALTNVGLNAMFIPIWGIEGAAAATLATQMLSNVLYPALFRETRGFSKLVLEAIMLKGMWKTNG